MKKEYHTVSEDGVGTFFILVSDEGANLKELLKEVYSKRYKGDYEVTEIDITVAQKKYVVEVNGTGRVIILNNYFTYDKSGIEPQ